MPSKPIPLPLPVEQPPEEKEKCPPKGSPAWMATFADIATLLMAFFVLILSFAEFNQPRFKLVSGSLKQAFGVQRTVPVIEQPKGTTILELNFSPSPQLAVTEELKQDTTDTTKPEVTSQAEEDAEETGRDGKDDAENDAEASAEAAEEASVAQRAIEALAEVLRETLTAEEVNVDTRDGTVVVEFDETEPKELPEQMAQVADALEAAAEATGQPTNDVLLEGLTEELLDLARAAQVQADKEAAFEAAERRAAIAEAELRVALRQQIGEGLVSVEQREDRVVVTVGAGGAFPSGDAELTDEAREIMSRIAFAAMGDASDIMVTGHTDSVPLSPSSPFGDNWGLAAARASSVVRELQAETTIDPVRMRALSRGESMPIADNSTAAGREENRRIEIEFQY